MVVTSKYLCQNEKFLNPSEIEFALTNEQNE